MTTEQVEEAKTIASELVKLKDRLGRIGMFKTMHAMDAATGSLGYELAARLEPSAGGLGHSF